MHYKKITDDIVADFMSNHRSEDERRINYEQKKLWKKNWLTGDNLITKWVAQGRLNRRNLKCLLFKKEWSRERILYEMWCEFSIFSTKVEVQLD